MIKSSIGRLWRSGGLLLLTLTMTGSFSACSTPKEQIVDYAEVPKDDRFQVKVIKDRQRNIGFQMTAVSSDEDALDLCHELCSRGHESCKLSKALCRYANLYPNVMTIAASCSVGKEQCRDHKQLIPRQCNCSKEK